LENWKEEQWMQISLPEGWINRMYPAVLLQVREV
jgi:hypothetical protein